MFITIYLLTSSDRTGTGKDQRERGCVVGTSRLPRCSSLLDRMEETGDRECVSCGMDWKRCRDIRGAGCPGGKSRSDSIVTRSALDKGHDTRNGLSRGFRAQEARAGTSCTFAV